MAGGKDSKAPEDPELKDIPHVRKEPRPDFSKPLPPHELPDDLKKIVERSDSLFDEIYDGTAPESTDSSLRYAAYATRFRTILISAQRYVAYTSDVAEGFRPVAHPWLIRGAYGVSWAYLTGDVAHEGYKAYIRNQKVLNPTLPEAEGRQGGKTIIGALPPGHVSGLEDWRTVMAQRAVFQSVASMGLPAFTIHSIVRYSGKALKDVKNVRIRTYGPVGLGLAAVPFLPFMFDKPVEEATEWIFHKGFETFGGRGATGDQPATGRAEKMLNENRKVKDKDL